MVKSLMKNITIQFPWIFPKDFSQKSYIYRIWFYVYTEEEELCVNNVTYPHNSLLRSPHPHKTDIKNIMSKIFISNVHTYLHNIYIQIRTFVYYFPHLKNKHFHDLKILISFCCLFSFSHHIVYVYTITNKIP